MVLPDEEDAWVPFSQRPEWADVRPLYPPPAGDYGPVVDVEYTDEWKETHAYMHAVLASGECSRRALEVATAVIGQNSADYSAWALRWACAQAAVAGAAPDGSSSPLLDELRFTEELAEESPKNYQLWNHRRLVAGALAQQSAALSAAVGEREDAFTAAVLEGDAKNYHAWAHRAWLAHTFADQPGRDLAFTRSHLELDDRNNSAWNGRFTTLGLMHGHSHWPPGVAAEELQLAHACLDADPGNESAWAYAVAVARAGDVPDALHDIARAVLAAHSGCSHAAGVLADAAEAAAAAAAERGDLQAEADAAQTARRLFAQCAAADPIRAPYWTFRAGAGRLLQQT